MQRGECILAVNKNVDFRFIENAMTPMIEHGISIRQWQHGSRVVRNFSVHDRGQYHMKIVRLAWRFE